MICKDCPITRGYLPGEAWAALKHKHTSYSGCVKMVKKNLCPMMQARDLQDRCRLVIAWSAQDTATYAKRSVIGYFRAVLVSKAAKAADAEQGLRALQKRTGRRGTGPQPIGELFGGI